MRRAVLALAMAGVLLVVAIATVLVHHEQREASFPTGTALGQSGVQSSAELGLTHVRVGDEVMFALPAFDNQTDRPLAIKSVRVVDAPDGFEILGYRTLTYEETDGMMLTWCRRTSSLPDVLDHTREGVGDLIIPARSVGERYALVYARIASPPAGSIHDVDVVYEQGGTTYRQTIEARWGIEMEGAAPGDRPSGSTG